MQEFESLITTNMNKFKKLNERRMENIMKKYDLRKIDIHILIYLSTYKDIKTAKDIVMMDLFTKGHISQSIKRLKEKGYVTASQDEHDMRMQNLQVTDLAKPIIKQVHDIRKNMAKTIYAGIEKEDIETMKRVFNKICENINNVVN